MTLDGFNKAKREKLKGAIALMGASGSGKTIGSLLVAYGMVDNAFPELSEEEKWEKIAFVDTEHRRALVYADMEIADLRIGEFLHMNLNEPYTVERYKEAVKLAKEAGAYVVVLDSITHAWEGNGGILDLQQAKGGTFQAWRKVNPDYKRFIQVITGEMHDIHVINTMRLKQDYAMGTGEDGRLKVEKLGMKPVQRDSLEYEFQVVWNIDMDHNAHLSKDNSGLFLPGKIDVDTGRKLNMWLDKGVDVKAQENQELDELMGYVLGKAEEYPEIREMVQELEAKAGLTVQEMRVENTRFLRRVVELVDYKYDEVKGAETVNE